MKQNSLAVAYIRGVLNDNGFESDFRHYDSIEALAASIGLYAKFLNRLRFKHKMLFPNKLYAR